MSRPACPSRIKRPDFCFLIAFRKLSCPLHCRGLQEVARPVNGGVGIDLKGERGGFIEFGSGLARPAGIPPAEPDDRARIGVHRCAGFLESSVSPTNRYRVTWQHEQHSQKTE